MKEVIRIGTRSSKLAMWQANHVAGLLKLSGHEVKIILIETRGDKILDVSISKIGSKGVFTEEIEAALLRHEIDIAVHSAKDLASEIPDELELIAFTEREYVSDALISLSSVDPVTNAIRLGTSSTRRIAFSKHYFPKSEIVLVRGNVPTRISKLRDGACDALILARAGIERLGINDLIVEDLPTSQFVPPVGQGSIAIQCHKKLDFGLKEVMRRHVNHEDTENCLLAERAFLKTLQGGCSVPAFGYAQLHQGKITLKGGIISLDGQLQVKEKEEAPVENAKALGHRVANLVLEDGGREILAAIKSIALK